MAERKDGFRRGVLSFLSRPYHIPKTELFSFQRLSPFDKALLLFLIAVLIISFLVVLNSLNNLITEQVPAPGGELVEGVVGSPRFINPLLSISDTDRDLVELIYAGLLKANPDGTLSNELASSYRIEDEGQTYVFVIREDAVFHDGEPVTADDVLFTVERAQDPALKSPKRANWDGVLVEKRSEKEVAFILRQPFAPFLENATLGILPEHIWKDATPEEFPFSQFNIEPIGSGPYEVSSIKRNASGIPTSYELTPNSEYVLGRPYISRITFRFYPNETALVAALVRNEVDSANSISPILLSEISENNSRVRIQSPLPRVFAVFFNQNINTLFTKEEVRKSLALALDREALIQDVLSGFGTPISGPLPAGFSEETSLLENNREEAERILTTAGWERNEETGIWELEEDDATVKLSFALTSSNVPELKTATTYIKEQWEEFGAEVRVQFFDTNDLTQSVIRPREYEALFFGEVIGRELDLFAFWHSSQRNDPGLNIALYANITADTLLEKARATTDKKEQLTLLQSFEEEVAKDVPAVFAYSPDFIYITPKRLKGASIGKITTASERFLDVYSWFIETDRVWSFFTTKPFNNR